MMLASLKYELKRILLPLCIFTVLATAILAVNAISARLIFSGLDIYGQPIEVAADSLIDIPAVMLGLLAFIVPAMQFAYRMNRRSVDLWYSLPVRREKLLAVRLIGGAILVVVPFVVAMCAGTAIIALRDNVFAMQYYPLYMLAALPLGLLLYLLNAFLFTRANSVWDGIVFMLAGAFIQMTPFLFLSSIDMQTFGRDGWSIINYMSFSPLNHLTTYFDNAIRNEPDYNAWAWISYGLFAAEGIAAAVGIILTAKMHRAENAGQVSDSLFGYRVYIPFCLFFITAAVPYGISTAILYVVFLIIAVAAYFVFRRSFRLKKEDLIVLFCSWAAGAAVSWLVYLI